MTLDAFTKKFKKIDLPLHGVRLPSFQISDTLRDRLDASKSEDNVKILRRLCYEGYEKRMLARQIDPLKAKEYTESFVIYEGKRITFYQLATQALKTYNQIQQQ